MEQKGMEKLRLWFKKGGVFNWKKEDWLILALAGVLLLVVAFPTGAKKEKQNSTTNVEQTSDSKSSKELEKEAYETQLEKRLEDVLAQMDGVGNVRVMITLKDDGTHVVEKDASTQNNQTTEADGDGGSRTITESGNEQQTVYVENEDGKYPYVTKEELPMVEGVVVVAQGADSPTVVTEISDAVQSLFSVEPHKIKVVKMRMQEESN